MDCSRLITSRSTTTLRSQTISPPRVTGSDEASTLDPTYIPRLPRAALTPVETQFDNLDEAVQAEFETFLEERGINSSLALLIPDLAEHKEQK